MKYQDVIPGQAENTIICTVNIKDSADMDKTLSIFRDFCDRIHPMVHSMRIRYPYGHYEFAMGIGARAWDRLFAHTPKPKELQPFQEIKGKKMTAPATPGDLIFHIRGDKMDMCYETITMIHILLKDIITPIDETHGFRYRDGLAIIGFVDGTENPDPQEAPGAVYIDDPKDPFVGGSYLFAQKYLFDHDGWNALPVERQEAVIGRKKWTDLEIAEDKKLTESHTEISKAHDKRGDELKIMRANLVFAKPSENLFGSYFLGYSKSFAITQQMLTHMFEGDPVGTHDLLLDYLTPVTGNVFFVPTYAQLEMIASGDIS
ncbi:MAG: Dyp-type peroxidase [Christensenella sp.]|nr:Dyp-type peroxidase [Christensenella sp.]